MNEIITALKTLVDSNQFISAIASGGIVVWIVSNIKSIYYTIRNFIEDIISFSIYNLVEERTIEYDWRQTAFEEIITDAIPLWERTINFNPGKYENIKESSTTYGSSIKLIYGKICCITRSYRISNSKNNIATHIRVFFAFKKNFMKKLENDIQTRIMMRKTTNRERNFINIFKCGISNEKIKRSINTIYTKNNCNLIAFDNIRKFLNNKEIYHKLNYPYKYSCCFYGKPGCGKTSTIHAIASELNRDIVYIDIANYTTYDLINEMQEQNSGRVIYVFEDIDAISNEPTENREKIMVKEEYENCQDYVHEPTRRSSVSLSDLLNITDGLLSSEGVICIFTTNHIERLDKALIRSGRMNDLIEFDEMDNITANKMIKNYLGYEIENLRNNIKPSDLQEVILNVMVGKMTKNDLTEKFREK